MNIKCRLIEYVADNYYQQLKATNKKNYKEKGEILMIYESVFINELGLWLELSNEKVNTSIF